MCAFVSLCVVMCVCVLLLLLLLLCQHVDVCAVAAERRQAAAAAAAAAAAVPGREYVRTYSDGATSTHRAHYLAVQRGHYVVQYAAHAH